MAFRCSVPLLHDKRGTLNKYSRQFEVSYLSSWVRFQQHKTWYYSVARNAILFLGMMHEITVVSFIS